MKALVKAAIGLAALAVIVFLVVFALAKARIVFINEWFVNEESNVLGVDVSAYQADIDMAALKAQDVEFAYIKASEGSSYRDELFAQNWQRAAEAGLPAGAYHFFSYDSPGASQAENFIGAVGHDISGRLLPAVDVEYYGDKEDNPPAKDDVVRELRAFLDAVEAEYGVKPMIYTRPDVYEAYVKGSFDGYPIWMSSLYKPLSWSYSGDWAIWQYLNRGELEGYSGGEEYIDLNILNPDVKLSELLVP